MSSITMHLPTVARPPLVLLGIEPWRAAAEFIWHRLHPAPAQPSGDGHPVVIFPGLASGARAVAPLRQHCEALGYAAVDWGRGLNRGPEGDLDTWLQGLAADTLGLVRGQHRGVTLIGWSLGGLYAREVAKLLGPQRVRQVITTGTPFNAEADHTHVGWCFQLLSGRKPEITPALARRLRQPPPVPTTSIYSRTDGIVAWQTCRHTARAGQQVEDVEVTGSHTGMGWNPAVLRVIADRLAQRPGHWRPYAAGGESGSAVGRLAAARRPG